MHTRVHTHLTMFPVWSEIFTTSTPTKPHMLRYVPGSEFSGGFQGQPLLVLLVRVIAFDSHRRLRFRFIPYFEDLYPLPDYRCRHSGPVKVYEMVCRVVVCASHHIRPESSFCELTHRRMLVVQNVVVNQYPVAFLDLLWS